MAMDSKKWSLPIICVNMFVALLGVGIIIPVLPDMMEHFHVGGTTAGYLTAAFGITQFFFSPLGGSWADRFGRKPLILSGLCLHALSHLMIALADGLWLLYVSRFLGGIGLGLMIPAIMAYVADITGIESRGKGMGYLSAAMSLGIAVGPGIGGFLAEGGYQAPFYAAAAVTAVAVLVTLFILPESLQSKNKGAAVKQDNLWKQLSGSLRSAYFIPLFLVFIMTFGLMNYETVFPLFAAHGYGFSAKEISVLITSGAIIGVITQSWLIGKLLIRFGERKLINATLLLAALSMAALLLSGNFWYILIVSMLFFSFTSLMRPALNTMLSKMASEKDQGFVAGLNNTYASLGNIFGPMLAGMLYDVHINVPYSFGAVALVAALLISLSWKAKGGHPVKQGA